MRHSVLRGLLVLVLLVAMLAWPGVARKALASSQDVVTPAAFDFGYVTVGQSVSYSFPLRNASGHAIEISAASLVGWPGSLALPVPVTLRPGEVIVAGPLTFEPTATGRYSSAIELTTNDPTWPQVTLPVSGRALAASPSIATIPAAFDFGYVTVGQIVSRHFTLRNVSTRPVSITDVSLLGLPGFPGDLAPLALPLILQPGESVAAGPLTFAATAAGWYASEIEITTDDPSSSLVAVPVFGRAAFATVLSRGPLPAVVAYGAGVEVTGTLTSSNGTPIADRPVVLETSVNGSPWVKEAQGYTSSAGAFAIRSPKLYSARYVRVAFEGDDRWAPGLSTAALVKPRASLGTPVAPSPMSTARAYTVHGSLGPAHTAGSAVGRLYCYRLESGRWILRRTFTITAYTSSGQGAYRASVRLASAGSWRMRAYHTDAGHAPTYSGWRYVTVR